MKTQSKGRFIIKGVVFGVIVAVAIGWIVMTLWNWLMPLIFSLGEINYWEALGILLLSRILFGGHGHGRHLHHHHREKYFRERFRERMEFAKQHHGEHFKPASDV